MKQKQPDPKLVQHFNALLSAQDIQFAVNQLREAYRITDRIKQNCIEIASIIRVNGNGDTKRHDDEVKP